MLGHWTNNIMGEVISKITGVQNDSKRIAEDTQSESQPLKKRKMNSISKKLADSTLSYVFGNAFNLPKKPLSLDEISKIQGLQHISEDIFKLLDKKSLMDCRLVNSSWKNVLDQPIIWWKKMNSENQSEDIQRSWKTLVKELNKNQISKKFVLVLMKIYQRDKLQSPLEIVVELQKAKKYPSLIRFILENEDINSKVSVKDESDPCLDFDFFDITPIHLAACYGLTTTVVKLLEKYDSSNIQTESDGDTPLICAAYMGHLETVKISAGFSDLNASDKQRQTPIFLAASFGHEEIVKFLVPRVENPNVPDKFGQTPILIAAWYGRIHIVKYLSKFIENPNAPAPCGFTPLQKAAREGHAEVVKFLSKFTENPNESDPWGITPLKAASQKNHHEVVQVLLQALLEKYYLNPQAICNNLAI